MQLPGYSGRRASHRPFYPNSKLCTSREKRNSRASQPATFAEPYSANASKGTRLAPLPPRARHRRCVHHKSIRGAAPYNMRRAKASEASEKSRRKCVDLLPSTRRETYRRAKVCRLRDFVAEVRGITGASRCDLVAVRTQPTEQPRNCHSVRHV